MLEGHPMRRLNLGSGGQIAVGWVNIDREFSSDQMGRAREAFLQHDLRDPLRFEDGTAEMAVAHHVLDLLEEHDLSALLAEIHRVLVPGGVLRISLIDLVKGLDAVRRDDFEWFASKGAPGDDIPSAYMWWLTCGGARKTLMVSPGMLGRFLDEAGFKRETVAFQETTAVASICDLDSREGESFFVEARKP
jgi:SAM-dependent methyltransferase